MLKLNYLNLSNFRFFLQEIQAGEALISSGDIEQGVIHLANAVVVCGQPTQLLQVIFQLISQSIQMTNWISNFIDLQVLQQTLPSQVFTLLIQRMREYDNKAPKATEDTSSRNKITEELDYDLE